MHRADRLDRDAFCGTSLARLGVAADNITSAERTQMTLCTVAYDLFIQLVTVGLGAFAGIWIGLYSDRLKRRQRDREQRRKLIEQLITTLEHNQSVIQLREQVVAPCTTQIVDRSILEHAIEPCFELLDSPELHSELNEVRHRLGRLAVAIGLLAQLIRSDARYENVSSTAEKLIEELERRIPVCLHQLRKESQLRG